MMKQRILTAVVALIILVPLVLYGGWLFVFGVYAFALIAHFELVRMYAPKQDKLYILASVLFLIGLVYPGNLPFGITDQNIITVYLLVLLAGTVLSKNRLTFTDAGFLMLATLFIGTAFQALIQARMAGFNYLLFILLIIWATDSGAYMIGKTMGKRKLWPAISPNKTWGGALGGMAMAIIVAVVFQSVYPFAYSLLMIVAIAFIISIFGQLGDLVASAIKRHYDVKDSGKLFPGHGGVLDRLDSLLFVLILLKLIQFI